MKKLLLSFALPLLFMTLAKSQVVFCPPGAVWHYSFKSIWFGSNQNPMPVVYFNEPITYTGDTTLNGETIKILKHNYFYKGSCGYSSGSPRTFIKQHGDTIFMKNYSTLNTWQILYNFATPVGGQWVTTVKNPTQGSSNNNGPTENYSVTVNSVQTVTINGMSLKQLTTSVGLITERIGESNYLFYFTALNCDGSNYDSFLCYTDNTIGTYQPTAKSCTYTTVGITKLQKETGISLYPNPTTEMITFKTEAPIENSEVTLTDVLGKEVLVLQIQFLNSETELDLGSLNKGIYFLKLSANSRLIINQKIIKE